MGKIFDSINTEIMQSMKAGTVEKTNALKNMKAKMLEFKTAKNAKPLDDAAEIVLIKKMVTELNNDADLFEKNGRGDLAVPARAEAEYLAVYLPKEASASEVQDAIAKYVTENGEFTQKEMGLVIQYVKKQFENVDGALVAGEVKKYLNN